MKKTGLLLIAFCILLSGCAVNKGSENISSTSSLSSFFEKTDESGEASDISVSSSCASSDNGAAEDVSASSSDSSSKEIAEGGVSSDISSGTENQPENSDVPEWSKYGLQVTDEGVVTLGGADYYGMGVNFFDPINIMRIVGERWLEEYFKALSEGDVPYIRMKFGLFYATEVSVLYDEKSRDEFLSNLDKIVKMAEKHNVGIIASLIWNANIYPDYCGETLDMIADPNSKSVKEATKYVTDIVKRYRQSPAIWAWEIGNELDLACDTWYFTNKNGKQELFTYKYVQAYYELMGKAIRENDPYRMIVGGSSVRSSSYALANSQGQDWTVNNFTGWKLTFERYTPAPLDSISLHYPADSHIKTVMDVAKELKIAVFIGEYISSALYNNPYDKESPQEQPLEKAEQDALYKALEIFDKQGVQLSCIWQFGRCVETEDNSSIELGIVYNRGQVQNYYAFEKIGEYNRKYVAQGKSKASEYWKNAK